MLIKLNVIVNSDKIRINQNHVYCKNNFLWNLKTKLKRSLKTLLLILNVITIKIKLLIGIKASFMTVLSTNIMFYC